MTRARASAAVLAMYFLARTTVVHANDIVDVADIPDDLNQTDVSQQDVLPDLESVPVMLSQSDRADDNGLPSSEQPGLSSTAKTTQPAEDAAASAATSTADDAGTGQPGLTVPAPSFGGMPNDAALISSAPAAGGDGDIFASAGAQKVSDEELSQQRGGFVYQGVDIRFGAEIRSYIGDELVMQTNFNWTDTQVNVERIVSTQLTPSALAEVQANMLTGGGLNPKLGDNGFFVTGDGQTAFLQSTDGSLQNVVVNSASNVALRQQIDANIDLANFGAFRNDAVSGRIVSALANMATTAFANGSIR